MGRRRPSAGCRPSAALPRSSAGHRAPRSLCSTKYEAAQLTSMAARCARSEKARPDFLLGFQTLPAQKSKTVESVWKLYGGENVSRLSGVRWQRTGLSEGQWKPAPDGESARPSRGRQRCSGPERSPSRRAASSRGWARAASSSRALPAVDTPRGGLVLALPQPQSL